MSTEEETSDDTLESEAIAQLLGDNTTPPSRYISPVPVMPQLGVALGLLVFVFAVTYVGATRSLSEQEKISDVRVDTALATPTAEALSLGEVFNDVVLEADSAIVWDMKNQRVLFNKNADASRPLASITKLMTALVAHELLDAGDTIPITLEALRVEGDSGLVDGEEFTLQNLSDLVLISSSNDGAAALSREGGRVLTEGENPEEVFVRAMNIKAEQLGLTKTRFKNSTGLDLSPTEAGAHGSARDVALLLEYIVKNASDATALTTMEVTTVANEAGEYHVAKNTNKDVGSINGLIASKTGYTALSGGNLAVAFNAGLNRPIIIVVLGSSFDGRFRDTERLIEKARQYTGR